MTFSSAMQKEGVQDRVEGVQDRVDAAQRLIDSIQGSGCKKEAKEATMAALELQARLRRRSSESDNLSSSGRSSGDSLASAALEAFKAIGHTVSCARELRWAKDVAALCASVSDGKTQATKFPLS